ncbi:unnamed protein product [Cercopithifilaria johnstoni]|uniref:EF-hand domain-containing protein n=1 Tax=Cercopithifilaria johnstoni TaxID=2874296 RepID=A0A8J2M077_9BILA|nr:unnamed protein product [Cercopithifilaria johnstoni]
MFLQEFGKSRSHQNAVKVINDDGNNNDSFVLKIMNLGGLSEKIDDKKCSSGVAAIQQSNSTTLLPPVSPSYATPIRTSKRNLINIANAVLSPPLSSFPTMQILRKNCHSESASFDGSKMDTVDHEIEVEISEHSNILQPIMNPDIFTKLLETPRKFKRFEIFEQDQENAWNCNRKIPNSPSYPNYDKNPYVMFPDENMHDKALVEKDMDTLQLEKPQILDSGILQDILDLVNTTPSTSSNSVIPDDPNDNDFSSFTSSFLSGNSDMLTSEKIEEKRNESSFEALLSDHLNSSTFHKEEILEETDPTLLNIPRFHYPYGIPLGGKENCNDLNAVKELFRKYNDQIEMSHMKEICLASGLCPLWKQPLYNCISTSMSNFINFNGFTNWWKKFEENAHDEASRFVYILTNGSRNYLTADDFKPLIQDLIETLPSLSLLKEAEAFHHAYIKTVTARIFWSACHSWKKHISIAELRLSNLLKAIAMLEKAEINEEHEFFSYEHFYVIYCNFYLLDKDEKNYLTPFDLSLYSNCALTNLVVQRIFSGAVLSNSSMKQTIDYIAFVNFLLAEVDKCHPKSIEYWFRIMDLNGDGRISFDEMERFYNEIVVNVIRMDMDVLVFNDLVNMLKDMISPHSSTYFTLSDFKRSPSLARYFFNTFINWIKHIAQESCLLVKRNEVDSQFSDWNHFCKSEYEILLADLLDSDEKDWLIEF